MNNFLVPNLTTVVCLPRHTSMRQESILAFSMAWMNGPGELIRLQVTAATVPPAARGYKTNQIG